MKNKDLISTIIYTFLILFIILLLSMLYSFVQKNKFIDTIKNKIDKDLFIIEPSKLENMVAIYVDGKKVTNLDLSKNYTLESYTCTNDEKVVWDDDEKSIKIKSLEQRTNCKLRFNENNT